MKRRKFFEKLGLVACAAIVAPKLIDAEPVVEMVPILDKRNEIKKIPERLIETYESFYVKVLSIGGIVVDQLFLAVFSGAVQSGSLLFWVKDDKHIPIWVRHVQGNIHEINTEGKYFTITPDIVGAKLYYDFKLEKEYYSSLFDEEGCMKRLGVQERWQISKESIGFEGGQEALVEWDSESKYLYPESYQKAVDIYG